MIPRYCPPSSAEGLPLNLDSTGTLPPPYVLGGPSRYSSWRTGQEAAILTSVDADARVVIECLPTGAGKSLIYMMEAIMSGERTIILTSTKGLQDQLSRDFGEMTVDVRGQTNYQCMALASGGEHEDLNPSNVWMPVINGPCMDGDQCTLRDGGCGYFDAIRAARRTRVVVTNYAFWLTQASMPPEMSIGQFGLVICDEAHNTVKELCDYMTVELTREEERWLYSATNIGMPSGNATSIATWQDWSKSTASRLESAVEGTSDHRAKRQARKLRSKLARMRTMTEDNWVMEPGDHVKIIATFEPIWPRAWAETLLFRSAKKVVMSSATVRLKTAELLGLTSEGGANHDEVMMFESPSTFDPGRRPVYHISSRPVDYRMTEYEEEMWVRNWIYPILESRSDRKGIIHAVSYKRRNAIMRWSSHSARMITHDSRNARASIEQFRHSPPRSGVVLVSPSVTTGYDFKYDECEYQIIAKLPRPNTMGAVMKARAKSDREYVNYMTMQALVQAAGRGMRAEDDRCETFITDDNVKWFMKKFGRRFAPKWFREAIMYNVGCRVKPPARTEKWAR